jgi:thiamine pyrophosphate-dependent acetolactate synthase large subunit-like protein
MLIVMFNNRSYYQDEGHQLFMAKERNRDPSKVGVGIRINDPPTDFANLARSFCCNGIGPVEDPELVEEAIKKALELVKKEKKPCLVDVITQSR